MSELSPAARAVSYAYDNAPEKETDNHRYHWLAAALRAAADHIDHDWSGFNCVDALCEIAAELEAQ
jgi:hypothetical protein